MDTQDFIRYFSHIPNFKSVKSSWPNRKTKRKTRGKKTAPLQWYDERQRIFPLNLANVAMTLHITPYPHIMDLFSYFMHFSFLSQELLISLVGSFFLSTFYWHKEEFMTNSSKLISVQASVQLVKCNSSNDRKFCNNL